MSGFSQLIFIENWVCNDVAKENMKLMFDFYENDLIGTFSSFCIEIEMWQKKLTNMPEKSNCALTHLNMCNELMFPNIKKLLKIYNTIPVTTAQIERYFSKLGLIKSKTRNATGQDGLDKLMFLSIHRDIIVTFEEFLIEFKQTNRRLDI